MLDDTWRNRRCHRLDPALRDRIERTAHAYAIDFPVGSKPADQHRNVVFSALAVGDIGEQESLAVPFLDAAAELPAHQWVHLGILVDGPRDRDQEPCRVERAHMIVQIGILACGLRALCRFRVGLGKGVHGAFRLDRVESFVRAFQ
jgi:hypothetical protein